MNLPLRLFYDFMIHVVYFLRFKLFLKLDFFFLKKIRLGWTNSPPNPIQIKNANGCRFKYSKLEKVGTPSLDCI